MAARLATSMGPMDGIILINKPQGPTSHDLVQTLRRSLGVQRIGHGGTLDPMASGVMVLLIGRATKLQQLVQQQPKRYDATVRLGEQTDTADAWGQVTRTAPVPTLEIERVQSVVDGFVGPLAQRPPAFSAVRHRGRRLYWWARRGTPVIVEPRTVRIYAAQVLSWTSDSLTCRVECSSGTYVRTLAEQIAERLGTVGHVTRLTRSAVGSWTLDDARDLAWLQAAAPDQIDAALLPLEQAQALLAPSDRVPALHEPVAGSPCDG